MNKLMAVILVLVLGLLALSCGDNSRPVAPDFSITDIQGQTVTLSSLKSKGATFLHFWSLSTPTNKDDMIDIAAGHQRWGQSVSFISVNVGDSEAEVGEFMRAGNYQWTFCCDSNHKLADGFKVSKLPTVEMITRDGIIWFSFNGGIVSGRDLDTAINHTKASK